MYIDINIVDVKLILSWGLVMAEMVGTLGSPSKARTITLWVLRVVVGLAFLAAGGAKLAGAPPMVAVFNTIGVGQWFRVLTGTLEVLGAIALLLPRFTFYGAILLTAVMIGAVAAHLTVLGGNPAPPATLLVLSGIVAWMSWDKRKIL
jgi:uncharacterized membrane protein YphA (DoxX/SURF4 family)